jgi:hypothetical protein
MPSFFSRLKGKDGPAKVSKSKKGAQQNIINDAPAKPRWEDAWTRKNVDPEEVQELLRGCTVELKSRGMETIDIFPFSIMHEAICHIYGALHRLTNCFSLQLWICLSSFSLSDLHQIRARPGHSFDISLIEVNDYMERCWHKNYG